MDHKSEINNYTYIVHNQQYLHRCINHHSLLDNFAVTCTCRSYLVPTTYNPHRIPHPVNVQGSDGCVCCLEYNHGYGHRQIQARLLHSG